MRVIGAVLLFAFLLLGGLGYLAGHGHFGEELHAGQSVDEPRATEQVAARLERQRSAPLADSLDKQILFGDLHVHTTFSFDAFNISLPMYQGEGAHPPADACDFARFCSDLDFWSINDHAEGLTPRQWRETKQAIRSCNASAGDPASPDLVSFLGWEWTQIGTTPETHFGHKNVLLLDTEEDSVPQRPIASRDQLFPGQANPYTPLVRVGLIAVGAGDRGRQPYHDFARFLEERVDSKVCDQTVAPDHWPSECRESAETPTRLFERMDSFGAPYMVIPHGNTWGFYTPALTSWDKQLAAHQDPSRHEPLIEVFSGHGNIEEYRPWSALELTAEGDVVCPAPSAGYVPECWRAGEIIAERCLVTGESFAECERRAELARANHVEAGDSGHLTVPGSSVGEWLDSGQCTDCYMPAYNHRPGGSVQYALALRDFSSDVPPKRFRFGLIGSSDVHTARAGTGYKEVARRLMTDSGLGNLGPPAAAHGTAPEPRSISPEEIRFASPYFERFASFFGAGGLVAAHAGARDRESIWNALERKEVYATSGDRILLWFDWVEDVGKDSEAGASAPSRRPMGSTLVSQETPRFEVRAVGAFEQKPGCPADSLSVLGASRVASLCGGECYNPSDRRKRIDRIEVVRIRPQISDSEDVSELIEDPWRILPCPADRNGCRVEFEDPDYASSERDTVYYVRAIQDESPTINGDQLRCERDEAGLCLEVDPCFASSPTDPTDDCLSEEAERAWSSPIFVDHPLQSLQ